MRSILCLFFVHMFITVALGAFGSHGDKVRLTDIQTLTLKSGMMTNARRSAAVPQLKCVGGTAGCNTFKPQVVQCYNRGSDGYDVQWECKTDMDNAYRFGSVDVTCEGYDYPDDPYVLRGSCGLEYTIDLTKEGYQQQQSGGHDYYGGQSYSSPYTGSQSYGYGRKVGSIFSDLLTLGVAALIIYIIYKTCVSATAGYGANNGYRPTGSGYQQPPPPGFRDEYTQPGCGTTYAPGTGGAGTGGGFWSGAFTGGILGYMLGNNRNNYYAPGYASPYTTGWGWNRRTSPGWFSSGSGSGFSMGGMGGGSTGTRTASGFGGTKRR